jgi:hypothetical protein
MENAYIKQLLIYGNLLTQESETHVKENLGSDR